MKATGKEPTQATTPTKNIRDIASHEYEVPYPPMLPDICNG